MTSVVEPDSAAHNGANLGVVTINSDENRADVLVTGDLDDASAVVLQTVIDSHLQAGRRYLRLNVGAVTSVDEAGAAVLADAHARSFAGRGTLILIDVSPSLRTVLADHGLERHLLILNASQSA
jgi:anti-anti-sigma factor